MKAFRFLPVFLLAALSALAKAEVSITYSPDGPWVKLDSNPILRTSGDNNAFDSFRVDDACFIVRDGKYWLYCKGRHIAGSQIRADRRRIVSPGSVYRKRQGSHARLGFPHQNAEALPALDWTHFL